MRKRGTELALQIVVVAALLLIVLVVIGFIFGWSIGDFTKGFKNCEAKGGFCTNSCEEGKQIFMADCPSEKGEERVCCLKP